MSRVQSTLSARIKELEGVLETTLVDRSKRHVVFTPVGIETVDIVKEVEDFVSVGLPREHLLAKETRVNLSACGARGLVAAEGRALP